MKTSITFLYISVISGIRAPDIKFSAITDTHYRYLTRTYLEEGNTDPPTEADPTVFDALKRLQICEDISDSGVFVEYNYRRVDMKEIQNELKGNPEYEEIFNRIYHATSNTEDPAFPYEYTNHYAMQEIDVKTLFPFENLQPVSPKKQEHVFVCLLRSGESEQLLPFYVSKAYNTLDGLKVHRYVFVKKTKHWAVLLAERSGEAVVKPDFNVELHYLEHRRGRHPVYGIDEEFSPSNLVCRRDPVCKLNSESQQYDQSFRLCAVILTSSYFKEKRVQYPRRQSYNRYSRETVSFRTAEGEKVAGTKWYREIMLECDANMTPSGVQVYYVSRAYKPNQVFVYVEQDKNIYLETLITNVGVVDENSTFEDVQT